MIESNQEPLPREVRYQTLKEVALSTGNKQFEYGKWLLASLLAVHGGSLLAISQAGEFTGPLYQACGSLLIAGVATALISGGIA